jgi:hypothetical protein
MHSETNALQRSPAFVDEVDSIVEFTDDGRNGAQLSVSTDQQSDSEPSFTDNVDSLQIFVDPPPTPATHESAPVFVDEVDDLIEFIDHPNANPAISES